MNKYYFTFGLAHPYHNHYVTVLAKSMEHARALMNAAHGSHWAFGYDDSQFDECIGAYGYKQLFVVDAMDEHISLGE